ncbi:MAG: ABC transporter permease subunit [Acidimicrobiia bacterium]
MMDTRAAENGRGDRAAGLRGFANLVRKEASAWTGTRSGWLQPLVWMAVLIGPLVLPLYLMRDVFEAETNGVLATGLEMFFGLAALAPSLGAVILMQGSVVSERQLGTAAWVLSKPVGRAAFLLAKLVAHGAALLVAALVLPGLVAYALLSIENGAPLPALSFAAALGVAALHVTFYLVLTLALGAVTDVRAVVLAVPLVLMLGGDVILGLAPRLAEVSPWLLSRFTIVVANGEALPTYLPLVATVLWSAAFTAIAIWRFGREDL